MSARWILKAAVQKGLSGLPRSDALNYAFQRHVTHGLPRDDSSLRLHVQQARDHLAAFSRHAATDAQEAVFYEFGAGWDLIGPLVYRLLGVRRQTLVDIRPNLRFELIQDALDRLLASDTGSEGWPDPIPGGPPLRSLHDLEARFGIRYVAPCDARATGLAAASVDFVSSTFTLEHIPARDIPPILTESVRLLRPGGIVSCSIDMLDHYSFFDSTVSPYNYLRFSDRTWALINSSLHYQNRLRLPDYLAMFRAAGLSLLETNVGRPTQAAIDGLKSIPLAERFRDRYELDDLAAPGVIVVAQKPHS